MLIGWVDDLVVQCILCQICICKLFFELFFCDEKCLWLVGFCCLECGGVLSYLGEDVVEQLELMCSVFWVIWIVWEKYVCIKCDVIVQVFVFLCFIEWGIVGLGLMVCVLILKYVEYILLYCQFEIYGCQGVELSCLLLLGWVDVCCWLLFLLEEVFQDYVLIEGKFYVDDILVQVLLLGNKKMKIGWLWMYVCDDCNVGLVLVLVVWFVYSLIEKVFICRFILWGLVVCYRWMCMLGLMSCIVMVG